MSNTWNKSIEEIEKCLRLMAERILSEPNIVGLPINSEDSDLVSDPDSFLKDLIDNILEMSSENQESFDSSTDCQTHDNTNEGTPSILTGTEPNDDNPQSSDPVSDGFFSMLDSENNPNVDDDLSEFVFQTTSDDSCERSGFSSENQMLALQENVDKGLHQASNNEEYSCPEMDSFLIDFLKFIKSGDKENTDSLKNDYNWYDSPERKDEEETSHKLDNNISKEDLLDAECSKNHTNSLPLEVTKNVNSLPDTGIIENAKKTQDDVVNVPPSDEVEINDSDIVSALNELLGDPEIENHEDDEDKPPTNK